MTAQIFADNLPPVQALNALIARHGLLRVLLALAPALLHRRRIAMASGRTLSRHMARDIGLPFEPPARTPWEMR